MTPPHVLDENQPALDLLGGMARAGLRFVVWGSAGIGLLHPAVLARYVLPDVDVLVPDVGSLRPLVCFLEDRGFRFTCWGEPLRPSWQEDDVVGKLYVRGERGPSTGQPGLRVDVTFEGAPFDVADAFARVVLVGSPPGQIPVCPERELWTAKLAKDAAACHRFAAAHGLEVSLETGEPSAQGSWGNMRSRFR